MRRVSGREDAVGDGITPLGQALGGVASGYKEATGRVQHAWPHHACPAVPVLALVVLLWTWCGQTYGGRPQAGNLAPFVSFSGMVAQGGALP